MTNKVVGKAIQIVKPVADRIGVGKTLRQAYVETLLLGERVKFVRTGRPSASSAILLAGSGRSGTTWIGDALCLLPNIQQIFEPFHPRYNQNVIRITGWQWKNQAHFHYFKSFYLRPGTEHPEWTNAIRQALTGRTRNYFTDYFRTSFFPDRFLIKDIWVNLMLGYISQRFAPQIVYIIRHPCAVLHSRLRVNWYASTQDILGESQLVEDYLQDFTREIEKETDVLGAHAVWWAVENYVALQQLQSVPHRLIFYEDLALHPKETLERLATWLGYDSLPSALMELLNKPSRTSNQQLPLQKNIDRLSRWKEELSLADRQRVLAWAERFGLTMYDETPLPKLDSYAYVP